MHTICATYAKIAAAFHGHGQQSWSTWLAGWLDFAIVFNRQRRQRPNEACNSPRTSATSNFKLMARKLRQALWAKVSKKPRQREQPLVGYSSYIAPDPRSPNQDPLICEMQLEGKIAACCILFWCPANLIVWAIDDGWNWLCPMSLCVCMCVAPFRRFSAQIGLQTCHHLSHSVSAASWDIGEILHTIYHIPYANLFLFHRACLWAVQNFASLP